MATAASPSVARSVTISEEMLQCLKNCQECHSVCLITVAHCLGMGGEHAERDHIRLMLDCAQICQTSADFMLRGSGLHARTCAVCAEVCALCAEDCSRFPEDRQMKACVEACRVCAASCRRMASGS